MQLVKGLKMKQIKEPKLIEVIANIRYEEKEDTLVQKISFVVPNKKYLPYLFDARFLFKNKIEKLIKDILLKGFIRRIDDIDNIEIIYEKQEKPKPCMKKLACYTPPYFGCSYCQLAQEEGLFIFCPEKNKHMTKPGVQRCKIFRVKEEIIT